MEWTVAPKLEVDDILYYINEMLKIKTDKVSAEEVTVKKEFTQSGEPENKTLITVRIDNRNIKLLSADETMFAVVSVISFFFELGEAVGKRKQRKRLNDLFDSIS